MLPYIKNKLKINLIIITKLCSKIWIITTIFYSPSTHCQIKKDDINYKTISVNEFEKLLTNNAESIVLDVRTEKEFSEGHLRNALNYSINDSRFENKISMLDKSKPIFVYCLSGGRSARVSEMLISKGFKEVYNLEGGMMKWKAANKPYERSATNINKGISMDNFNKAISSKHLVLVDFFGVWCGPCKKMTPFLDKIAKQNKDFKLLKIDIDKNQEVVESKNLDGVPYLELYKDGKLVWTKKGFIDENGINEVLDRIRGMKSD